MLASREDRERGPGAGATCPHEDLHHLGIDHGSAGDDRLDRRHQLVRIGHPLLEEVGPARTAGIEEREHVARIGELAEHDDADVRIGDPQRPRDLDALVGARGRHPDVREHRIGSFPFDGGGQRIAIAADGHRLDVVEPGHDPLERLAHQKRVLADHEANGLSWLSALGRGVDRRMRHGASTSTAGPSVARTKLARLCGVSRCREVVVRAPSQRGCGHPPNRPCAGRHDEIRSRRGPLRIGRSASPSHGG